ncbi:MAG: hypothetical protein Q8J88_12445 [Bacteroidales bacterium]|nr:hypothetical protein [Bacteroidales bacterium]
MGTKLFRSNNKTAIYLIAVLVIVIAFFLLDGDTWFKGSMHGHGSSAMNNLQWIQILIGVAVGFVLGLLYARRR